MPLLLFGARQLLDKGTEFLLRIPQRAGSLDDPLVEIFVELAQLARALVHLLLQRRIETAQPLLAVAQHGLAGEHRAPHRHAGHQRDRQSKK